MKLRFPVTKLPLLLILASLIAVGMTNSSSSLNMTTLQAVPGPGAVTSSDSAAKTTPSTQTMTLGGQTDPTASTSLVNGNDTSNSSRYASSAPSSSTPATAPQAADTPDPAQPKTSMDPCQPCSSSNDSRTACPTYCRAVQQPANDPPIYGCGCGTGKQIYGYCPMYCAQ